MGKRYPLPSGRERDYGIHCPLAGKRYAQSRLAKGMVVQVLLLDIHHLPVICNSGSLATGTGGVVGLAAGGVDGGVKFGSPGTLVSPGRGNSRYICMKELEQDFRLNVTDP